ncbi:uncharacterized protein TNCV_3559511 [Trichonephila clavipes]|uniref:Uncharacterized protein n=1 Tax=Trichonephila clavipes TaxID=2585209 RepID=A0A8X6WCM2_TRICX|nr:uncharacterized protein TNCV_3559511 [Trichonephila clavipes]
MCSGDHDTWNQFLREFAYAIRKAVNETTGETPAYLFLGRKLITLFQKLVMISDGTEFSVGYIERLFHEARRSTKKSDVMEIRTGSSNSNSSRHKSSTFESVQRRSSESQYGRKKKSGVKRELEEKGIRFLRTINVRDTQVRPICADHLSDYHLALGQNPVESSKLAGKRLLGIKDRLTLGLEDQRGSRGGANASGGKRQFSLTSNNELQCPRKKTRGDEIVMPSTSGYNLRPRRGAKVESRPTNEMTTQQGGPVRATKSREHHYSPYIEEQARSSSENTRSRRSKQHNCKEEKGGANSNRSISLEVLVGDVNYKS